MILIGGNWFADGVEREIDMMDSSLHAASSGPVARSLSPSDIAHADVIDYVLGLNELAGEPVAKAHEIYREHRNRVMPLLKAQKKLMEDDLVLNFPDKNPKSTPQLLELDKQIASVYLDCLQHLKALWLVEFSEAKS